MTYPLLTFDPSTVEEIFDGETWRAVDPPGNAAFYNIQLAGSEGSKIVLALGAQIAGQANAQWVSIWLRLPPVRFIPPP